MDLMLKDKVVLISGGSKGIGFACVEGFLKEGAKVAFFSSRAENIHDAVSRLAADYDQEYFLGIKCDYSDQSSVDQMLASVEKRFSGIDIFIGSSGGPTPSNALSLDETILENAYRKNLWSLCSLAGKLIPAMIENKFGRIIFITTSGVVQPIPGLAASNVIRSALTSYAKTLSAEVAHHGITVNTVIPGKIDTDRLKEIIGKNAAANSRSLTDQNSREIQAIPLGRFGSPQEIANLVIFLSSEKACYITGTKIPVDGGMINVT